ncbi:hypothetical protein N7540_006181 [Penicillium herquei]|nr:hypothetical protein N7540_006181 [Penicillium herquei]
MLKVPSLVEVLGNLEETLPKNTDVIPWGSLLDNPIDLKLWFEETTSIFSDQARDFIYPAGTLEASIGIVFGCIPCHQYQTSDGNICNLPWGLKEVGFNDFNSLVWSYNLQNFKLIPETSQSRPSSNLDVVSLRKATQKLILGSKLRIILVCGDEAEHVVIPESSLSAGINLELHQGVKCRAWAEHDTKKIKRLFIRIPYLPCELWSRNAPAIYDLTSIFRLLRALTGVQLRSLFYESGFVVSQVITAWGNEKLGKSTCLKPQDLEPLLRLWLAERGFDNDEDLERLAEAAGGSLQYAIQVMISCHPKRDRGKGQEESRGIHRARHVEYQKIPTKIQEAVTEIFKQKSPALFQTDKTGLGETDCELEAPDESIMDHVNSFNIPIVETDMGDGRPRDSQGRSSRILSLLFGSRHQGAKLSWNKTTFAFTIHTVRVYLQTEVRPPGGFWIRAEISPVGERHPNLWALDAKPEDPGSRLAIRISLRDSNDCEMEVLYPSSNGEKAACQANGLMDALNGDHIVQIAKRPRRYVLVHKHSALICKQHPFLNGFIGGGYTDDDGNLIQHNRGKSRKRPREEGEDVPGTQPD